MEGYEGLSFWRFLLFLLFATFISVALHEAGHIIAAKAYGLSPQGFGWGLKEPPYVTYGSSNPAALAAVAFAGPLINALLLVIILISARKVPGSYKPYLFIARRVNIFLLVFNLLPFPGLDGWHVLKGLVHAIA